MLSTKLNSLKKYSQSRKGLVKPQASYQLYGIKRAPTQILSKFTEGSETVARRWSIKKVILKVWQNLQVST